MSKFPNKKVRYHKCGNSYHFIKKFPVRKLDYTDYIKNNPKKVERRIGSLINSKEGQLYTILLRKP